MTQDLNHTNLYFFIYLLSPYFQVPTTLIVTDTETFDAAFPLSKLTETASYPALTLETAPQ